MSLPEFPIKVEGKPVEVQVEISGVFDPIKDLKDLIKNEEWFRGVIVSTVYIEVFGLWFLQARFENKIKPGRFERLGLEQIIMFLLASGLIDQQTYTRMMEVRRTRNRLVHKLWGDVTLDPKKAKSVINKAIKCLEALGPNK